MRGAASLFEADLEPGDVWRKLHEAQEAARLRVQATYRALHIVARAFECHIDLSEQRALAGGVWWTCGCAPAMLALAHLCSRLMARSRGCPSFEAFGVEPRRGRGRLHAACRCVRARASQLSGFLRPLREFPAHRRAAVCCRLRACVVPWCCGFGMATRAAAAPSLTSLPSVMASETLVAEQLWVE